MKEKKKKSLFVDGAIPSEKIANSISNHSSKTNIGAHSIFLGQVRADQTDKGIVNAIEYSSHEEMANETYLEIREEVFSKFDLTCAHVHHSLGKVNVGELCFFVFISSKRRKMAIDACEYFVEEIKKRLPIFGKEVFENENHQWKVNQ